MIHPAILFGGLAVMLIVSIIVGKVVAHLSKNRWIGIVAGFVFFILVDHLSSLVVVYD